MTTRINFGTRFGLINFLGPSQGTLKKMMALQDIYRRLLFSDDEAKLINKVEVASGVHQYVPPSPDWGGLDIQFTSDERSALLDELTNRQDIHITDVEWMRNLRNELNKE